MGTTPVYMETIGSAAAWAECLLLLVDGAFNWKGEEMRGGREGEEEGR